MTFRTGFKVQCQFFRGEKFFRLYSRVELDFAGFRTVDCSIITFARNKLSFPVLPGKKFVTLFKKDE